MSDQTNKDFQALVEQIRQLGLDPETDAADLPPQVLSLLNAYQIAHRNELPASAVAADVWKQVNDSITTDATTKTVTKAQTTGVVTTAEKKTLEDKGADTTGLAVTDTQSPRWVLDQFQGDPTSEQQARIVEEWNTVFGTSYTYDELTTLSQFQDPTDVVQKVVQGAQLDIEPQVEYAVTLPGNRSYKISSDQQKAQFGQYGYDNKDVVKLVRWADTFNLKDEQGDPAWQPLAALFRAKGYSMAPDGVMAPSNKPKPADQNAGLGAQRRSGHPAPPYKPGVPIPPDLETPGKQSSIAAVVSDYANNLTKYGDPSMAFLATMDPALADRVVITGGDVTKLSEADFHLIDAHLTAGAWSPQALHAMNYAGGSGWEDFFTRMNQRTNAAKDAGGSVRVRPDPDAVKQSVKDLWRKWFRAEPSDNLVAEMAGNIMAVAASAPKDQSIDVEAQLRKLAEGTTDYQKLYGQKQPGQTEMDYQQQFEAGSQSLLGNEAADNGSILAGMRTGQYQTTIGSTAGSARAWQNSTFLGRLATASQIVNEKT